MNFKKAISVIMTVACALLVALAATLWLGNAIAAIHSHNDKADVSSYGTRVTISVVVGLLPLLALGIAYKLTKDTTAHRIRRAFSKAAWVSWPFLLGFFVYSV